MKNLLSQIAGDVGSRVLGFFITVYMARVLGPGGFGVVSLGLAALSYLQLAGSPGIQLLEVRNAAALAVVDHQRVGSVLSLRLVLASVLWVVTTGVALLFVADGPSRNIVLLFLPSLFPLALMLDWFFQGKESLSTIAVSRLLQYVVYGLLVILLIRTADDVYAAAIAFGAGLVVAAVILWVAYSRRWGRIPLQWSPVEWRAILRKGIPVGAAMLLAQSVTNLPPIVIGYLTTAHDVGIFSSALKLIFLLLMIDRLFNALFLPVVTRYFSSGGDDLHGLVATTLRVLLAILVPLVVVGIILGRHVVLLVFGPQYENSTILFDILLGYVALTVLNSVFVCILVGSNNEQTYTRMLTWGSVWLCAGVVGGTLLMGPVGAAIGVVLGEFVTTALMMNSATEIVKIDRMRIFLLPLLAGVCMTVVAYVFQGINPFALAVVGITVFLVVDVLLKGVTMHDVRFLRERFV